MTLFVHLLICSTFLTCQLSAQAVVPTTNSTSSATGDGVTNTFTFTFELLQASDMTVYVNGGLQTQSVAYIVSPTGGSYPCTGGTITFQATYTPANAAAILMARMLTLTQTINLPVEGSLPSSTLQTVFDRACMQIQQISTAQSLSLQLPITSVGLVNTALPTPVALNLIGWDSGAMNIVNYTPQQIVAQAASSGVIGPGTTTVNGAIPTWNNTIGTLLGTGIVPVASGNVVTDTGTGFVSKSPILGQTQIRIYLVSGSPEADGSSSGNTTVYVGPYKGNLVTQDNGSGVLSTIKLTEIGTSISSLVNGDAYSVYIYNNAGTETVEIDQDWTNPITAPSYSTDALGRLTKPSSTNKLLVGEFYCSSTGHTNDYIGERSVSNEFNELSKAVFAQDTTSSWTYATPTLRAANANTTNGQGRVTVFSRKARAVNLTDTCLAANNNLSGVSCIGIGINSTSTAIVIGGFSSAATGAIENINCSYTGTSALGLNYYQRVESAQTSVITTYYGTLPTLSLTGCNALTGVIYN